MKKNTWYRTVAVLVFACFSLFAQEKSEKMHSETIKGYLMDGMCATMAVSKGPEIAMAKAAKHSKSCALEDDCVASGYGVMSDGKFIKFDKNGDKKALTFVKKTDKQNHIMIEVTGTKEKDNFKVSSIKEIADNAGATDNTKKSDMHEHHKMN